MLVYFQNKTYHMLCHSGGPVGKEGRFEKHTEMPETRRLKSKKLF